MGSTIPSWVALVFCPQVHCEQFGLHLGQGMLHHKVVDLLGVFVQPCLLIMGVVGLPLPFYCLDKVGRILGVIQESDGWLPELTNCQCCKRAVKLQMVCNVLGDGFELRLKVDAALAVPMLSKNNVFKALCGCNKKRFLWGEGAAMVEFWHTFDLGFLLSLGWLENYP